jgi:hypothetical protein
MHLLPTLDYIAATAHTKTYQARHARSTQLPLQAIQGFKDNGEAKSRYLAIWAWCLSSRATFEDAI